MGNCYVDACKRLAGPMLLKPSVLLLPAPLPICPCGPKGQHAGSPSPAMCTTRVYMFMGMRWVPCTLDRTGWYNEEYNARSMEASGGGTACPPCLYPVGDLTTVPRVSIITDWQFAFDRVLHNRTQADVFEDTGRQAVNAALEGVSQTLMAYGECKHTCIICHLPLSLSRLLARHPRREVRHLQRLTFSPVDCQHM